MSETSRPSISDEARSRMTAFVVAVQELQQHYGVAICAKDADENLALRDLRRTEQWIDQGSVYGWYDAEVSNTGAADHTEKCGTLDFYEPCICGALEPGLREENIIFEDFDGWGK